MNVAAPLLDTAIVAVSAHDEGNRALSDAGAHAVCPKHAFARIEEAIQRAMDARDTMSPRGPILPALG